MLCPNCQNANPDDARFCNSCGTKLLTACRNCGHLNPPESRFCNNCGQALADAAPAAPLQDHIPQTLRTKLETARAERAMVGERRVVTMLFCDVKGSTAAAGQLDPEEWAEIMNGAFERMIKPVYDYEGTVPRLMGDAILAFFGAPIAHEDDPERAVLAGLEIVEGIQPYREEMRRKWGVDFDVRVGINTGLVMVGQVGSDLRMEYTALGDAINLAARMEQTAKPGTLQVTEDTHKLIAPVFDFEDLGGVEVKGKDEPIHTYRVLRRKAERGSLRGIAGLDSPLVGRDTEMHALQTAMSELRQGRGRIISIIGEAGLGKSRLVAELRKSTAADDRRWLEGRSFSYEASTYYAPFADLFNAGFELRPEQSNPEKYAALKARVAATLPQHTDELAPFLATMLQIQFAGADFERVAFLEPPQLRGGIFYAVTHYLEHLAKAQPLVLVFDDVHWIDPTSFDLLLQLLPLTDRVPLAIVALFRPQRQDPSWRLHETAARDYSHRYTALTLEPLNAHSAAELVGHLLRIDDLPQKVRNLILAKAEGNPFFVEEVIRSLLDAGLVYHEDGHWHAKGEIANIAVPDTLAAVITARLDRLDDEARQVVQTASVIGREFPFDTLNSVRETQQALEPSLADLQRRELIREKSALPLPVYIFKHVLTQETAYASLLLKKRRELHRRVAECLEASAPERTADIARHFVQAQEPARALPYLVDAGERAAHAYATTEAIGFFEQALDIANTMDNLPLARRVYEGLGSALSFANEFGRALEVYQRELTLGRARDDAPMQVSALNKMSFVASLRMGQFDTAQQYMLEADQLAREHEDKSGLSELGLIRCQMCTVAADFQGVVRYMGETLQLGREMGSQQQMTMSLAHIASSQTYMLQFDQAWKSLQEGLRLAREIGDRLHEAEFLTHSAPIYHLRNGDAQAAEHAATEGVNIAQKIGAVIGEIPGIRILGLLAFQRGEYERALDCFQRYLDTSRATGFNWFVSEALCLLGSTYLEISPIFLKRTADLHQQALQVLQQPAGALMGASVWAELGFCAQAIGEWQRAREYFELGLTQPTMFMNLERPRLLAGSAFSALAQNDVDEAARLIQEASAFADKHALQNHYALVAFAQGLVNAARGESQTALNDFSRTEALAGAFNMRPLILKTRIESARLLSALGRADEAQTKRDAARALMDELAGFFTDDDLREKFLAHTLQKLNSMPA